MLMIDEPSCDLAGPSLENIGAEKRSDVGQRTSCCAGAVNRGYK